LFPCAKTENATKGNGHDEEHRDILMMSPGAKVNLAKAGLGPQPAWCAHVRSAGRAPQRANKNLHFKGFFEGVPPNTETAAVNPRAGVE
jgi:hypothetical protein